MLIPTQKAAPPAPGGAGSGGAALLAAKPARLSGSCGEPVRRLRAAGHASAPLTRPHLCARHPSASAGSAVAALRSRSLLGCTRLGSPGIFGYSGG